MKSIKEKAQEWADIYPSCGMADKSFQAGANYALDAIEKSLQEFSNYEDSLIISRIIEQLKSNQ